MIFQSTRPVRGGTGSGTTIMAAEQFQSTRPVRGGTYILDSESGTSLFQSTRPVRGGTGQRCRYSHRSADFNPPAPCGAGRPKIVNGPQKLISIHPPRAGRDMHETQRLWNDHSISIHPPRAGRDMHSASTTELQTDFNPPAPCGAGLLCFCGIKQGGCNFNPPAPCGAGHHFAAFGPGQIRISIHPPRAGRDNFLLCDLATQNISIHPPRAGRDPAPQQEPEPAPAFQSTRPVRGGTSTADPRSEI